MRERSPTYKGGGGSKVGRGHIVLRPPYTNHTRIQSSRIASKFVYVLGGWVGGGGHRPAKSGWLLFRSDLKYVKIEADDRCVYGDLWTANLPREYPKLTSWLKRSTIRSKYILWLKTGSFRQLDQLASSVRLKRPTDQVWPKLLFLVI